MFAVSAGVSPEKLNEAVQVILEELEKMTQELVGADELKKATDYTVGSLRLGLESTMSLGQRAGENLLTMGEIEPLHSVVEKLRSVTPEDLLRVAQRILRRDRSALALVGPAADVEGLAAVLGPDYKPSLSPAAV